MQVLNGKHAVWAAVISFALAAPALCQTSDLPIAEPMSLSGPRFGMTVLSDGIVRRLKDDGISVAPAVSQFGWQFERQWASSEGGPSAVTEWVVLFGGLDQGVVLPSLSWLAGMRTRSGTEFGVGPNVTPVGVALVIAAGTTLRAGALNIPFNVAVVPSKSGTRVSVLTGFNRRKQ
jgi:hypothetical protein